MKHLIVPLELNYNHSLNEMFKLGKYENADDYRFDNFDNLEAADSDRTTVSEIQKIDLTVMHFGTEIHTEAALHKIEKEGMRPVTLFELLSLGSQHPLLQLGFPIVALRMVYYDPCERCRLAAMLGYESNERYFAMPILQRNWGKDYRFATVQKNTQTG